MRITESGHKQGAPIAGQSSNQTPEEPTTKARSPTLKPKAGAGTAEKIIEGFSSQPADKVKPKPKVEESQEPENQNRNTTTTKRRRAKIPGKVPLAPQRRSVRIMESAQKAAQDKLTIPKPSSPILKPKARAGVYNQGVEAVSVAAPVRGGTATGGAN